MTDGGRAGRALGRGSKVFSPPAVAGRPGRPAARTASKARPWPRRDEGQPPSSFHSYTPCQPPAEPNRTPELRFSALPPSDRGSEDRRRPTQINGRTTSVSSALSVKTQPDRRAEELLQRGRRDSRLGGYHSRRQVADAAASLTPSAGLIALRRPRPSLGDFFLTFRRRSCRSEKPGRGLLLRRRRFRSTFNVVQPSQRASSSSSSSIARSVSVQLYFQSHLNKFSVFTLSSQYIFDLHS